MSDPNRQNSEMKIRDSELLRNNWGLSLGLLSLNYNYHISGTFEAEVPPSPFQLQAPSTLAVCLSACLTLYFDPLPIDSVLVKHL